MWLYLNDKYVEHDKATISPFDRGFLFSDGIYEVVRFYPPRGFFQVEAHLERMRYGLEQLRIKGIDIGRIRPIIEELATRNGHKGAQAIAYIQATRGAYFPRQHFFPPPSTPPTLLISTSPFKPHAEEIEKGVRVLLEKDIRWSRCDIKTIALLPNILSRQSAVEQAACETIWSRDGFITEGTHTNFCAVKNGMLLTPRKSNFILSGITRQVVLHICRNLNISSLEASINESELSGFDECMIVGTTTEVTPVVKINELAIGNGMPGEMTRRIQKELYRIIAGN
ncbi:MAG: aminotransferase class IV [Ignavibacteriales bacterium]|nr:aminotransferase class IV [Ignavibacteriales bacterium]